METAAVLLFVGVAMLLVGRSVNKTLKAKDDGCGCGGGACSTCKSCEFMKNGDE